MKNKIVKPTIVIEITTPFRSSGEPKIDKEIIKEIKNHFKRLLQDNWMVSIDCGKNPNYLENAFIKVK